MICVVQKVSQSSVIVEIKVIGSISSGMMVLYAKFISRNVGYRMFADEQGKMNHKCKAGIKGGVVDTPVTFQLTT